MAKKTKNKSESQVADALDETETAQATGDQPDRDGPVDAGAETQPVPDVPRIEIKPSTPLAGEAELAERKGTWTYDGSTPAGAAENAPVAANPVTEDNVAVDGSPAEEADARAETSEPPLVEPTDAPSEAKNMVDEPAGAPSESPSADPVAATTETAKPADRAFAPAPQVTVERKGGFVPMLLGGVVAAAVGFVAADATQPGGFIGGDAPVEADPFEAEARSTLESVQSRLDALDAQVAEVGSDDGGVTALQEAVAAVQSQLESLSADVSAVTASQSDLDARVIELAQAPITENVSEAAIAAYEQELAALQESIATQRAEIETLAEAAAERESQAQTLAQEARIQSAAAAVIVQVESGAPFADELAAYTSAGGAPVDAALSDLADEGVPRLEGLQESFPDAARAALAAARDPSTDASDGSGGLGTYLARQLSARSVAPREGDDPDAVLSRAEAAVRSGDLSTALSEIETLPDAARSALADWEATATARRDAMAAATTLTASANSN